MDLLPGTADQFLPIQNDVSTHCLIDWLDKAVSEAVTTDELSLNGHQLAIREWQNWAAAASSLICR